MAVRPRPYRFTVEDYHRMGETGILGPDERVELIEGEIVQMPPIGSGHASVVDRLTAVLASAVAGRAIVRVQGPVRLDRYSEPQPDLLLLRHRSDYYAEAHPGPGETILAIEVADTTLRYDRGRKLPLYARSGIPEVWLVDLKAGRVEIHRSPTPDGYGEVRVVGRDDRVAPQALPDLEIAVTSIRG